MTDDILSLWIAVICSAPFFMGLLAGVAYLRHPMPPRWAIGLLAFMGVGCALIFVALPIPPAASIPFVSGAVACGSIAIAMILRRLWGTPLQRGVLFVLLPLLPALAWIDLRFQMIIRDAAGNPVEIEVRHAGLHHPPKSYFQSYEMGRGKRMGRGRIYYGFILWVRHKGEWTFPSEVYSKEMKLRGRLDFHRAGWSEWPKVVTMVP